MKKIIIFAISFLLIICSTITAFAAENENGTNDSVSVADSSQPRLMVTSYKISDNYISPNKKKTVEITFKNFSRKKEVRNIKLSLNDETGDINPVTIGTAYVSSIKPSGEYVWKIDLKASKTAQIGEHTVNISTDYEDKNATAYSASDIIRITVKQKTSLDYDGAILPKKLVQGDTQTIDINLMNTGKSKISNCKITYDIDSVESGGATFVGEIPVGESKVGSGNLRVSSSKLGDVSGKIVISYEDEFGTEFSKTEDVSSTVVKKVVAVSQDNVDKKEKKNNNWWLFLLIGVAVGGTIGCAIPISINSRKRRHDDEMRL